MTLVVAAMNEELRTATALFAGSDGGGAGKGPGPARVRTGRRLRFARLGIGPARSSSRLGTILDNLRPDRVLCIGYAGALDPSLRAGDLVLVERAIELESGLTRKVPLGELESVETFVLAGTAEMGAAAARAPVPVRCGSTLTSPQLIGDPAQKQELFERFGACVVDMETAALARVCRVRSIPFSCVRAVSDEAIDGFLAPLRYDPAIGSVRKAVALLCAGDRALRFRKWRSRSAAARKSLRCFLEVYLGPEFS